MQRPSYLDVYNAKVREAKRLTGKDLTHKEKADLLEQCKGEYYYALSFDENIIR